MTTCKNCGARVQEFVNGTCPYCKTEYPELKGYLIDISLHSSNEYAPNLDNLNDLFKSDESMVGDRLIKILGVVLIASFVIEYISSRL